MKLALGTAQFGLEYGIANSIGQTSVYEVERIINRASQLGIDTLDTAAAYGDSEHVLGRVGMGGWKVVTKIPSCAPKSQDVKLWVQSHIQNSLVKLGIDRLDAVLLHDASDLLKKGGVEIAGALQEMRSEGLVNKVGYSIYSPDSLKDLMNVMLPDLIQAPFNVLDQRLAKSGWLRRFINAGIEVHVRSVFLQGLLLMTTDKRPSFFNRWNKLWQTWDAVVAEHDGSALSVCLGHIKRQQGISRVIIGVDSLFQLEQLVTTWHKAVAIDGDALACDDPLLVDPFNWG